jgi:hypothetical protein
MYVPGRSKNSFLRKGRGDKNASIGELFNSDSFDSLVKGYEGGYKSGGMLGMIKKAMMKGKGGTDLKTRKDAADQYKKTSGKQAAWLDDASLTVGAVMDKKKRKPIGGNPSQLGD